MVIITHEDNKKVIHYIPRIKRIGPMHGRIKFINKEKAYGFITSNEVDYYFSTSKLVNDQLKRDDLVQFTAHIGKRGETATNIKLI